MATQHGYWKDGVFIPTATEAEAVNTWRANQGYSTGGVYDMGDHVVDTRNAPSTPTVAPVVPPAIPPVTPTVQAPYSPTQTTQGTGTNWGSFYSQGSMPISQASNTPAGTYSPTQATQGVGNQTNWGQVYAQGSMPQATSQPSYSPTQATQGIGTPGQQTQSNMTPAEQRAAGGGGVPANIEPYSDLQSWFNPFSAGGYGTPTELRAGGGYGPSSVQWSESANNLALMQQGVSPVAMAENAVNTTYSFLTDFGVRPNFVTPYVQQRLGLSPEDMISIGYAQDPYGRWILLDFGEAPGGGGGASGSGGYGGGYGGGGYGSGYGGGATGGSSFRSGYTSGLVNWRIGIS